MKEFLSDKIKSWVIYIFYSIFILTCLNTCNTCSRNKENKFMKQEIVILTKHVDSLSIVIDGIPNVINDKLAKTTYFGIRTYTNFPNADYFKVEEESKKFLNDEKSR